MFKNFISPELFEGFSLAFKYLYLSMPIWLPLFFIYFLFQAFLNYKRLKFWQKESSMLLEIKLPKEINRSPAAMEVVLGALHQGGGEGTLFDRLWKGQTRSWFSLEIVSIEGNIRFFIWTKPKHRNVIESNIYSQYPGVEIYEASDYAKSFYYDPAKKGFWGTEFALTKADPYPIKTYIDYGLDKDPKEEVKIDPITPMLEFLGSITSGQNICIQILIRAHKKRRALEVFGEKEDSWKDSAKKEMEDIMTKYRPKGDDKGRPATKGETDMITALERSISKFPFDCGIRAIYIAEKDKFNPANIGGIAGSVKQYGSESLNGFRPNGWFGIFDYDWQKKLFNAEEKLKPKLLEEYKLRRYFYSPYMGKKFYSKPFVLNVEELATIFHFPGSVAGTPTLEKIPSLKSKAPSNLPI